MAIEAYIDNETSISYIHNKDNWDWKNIIVGNGFDFHVALIIIRNDDDHEP